MTINLPSTNFYTLAELDFNLNNQVLQYNPALLNCLKLPTLSAIRNAFARGILVMTNGLCYVKVSELSHLLRTSNSGADTYYWQRGISGYVSPSSPHTFGNDIYISAPDFAGLLDARIQSTEGNNNLYLRYVRALYISITSSPIINDLKGSFLADIDSRRSQLKNQRISKYEITLCEFTGISFSDVSEVEFAHIDSVTTAPLKALNVDNGVIILKRLHAELTRLRIHDFAGMYDYCLGKEYFTIWADNYDL